MRLLIVEDEPLVQVGIQSMIDWKRLDIEICGVAANGKTGLDEIEKFHPEIVIADIQMPVMDGLTLMKKSFEQYGELPVFILLTGYKEFDYLKTAIQYQVIDYLVKLDLTPESLESAIVKAQKKVLSHRKNQSSITKDSQNLLLLQDRFFSKLLNNRFRKDEMQEDIKYLNLGLEYAGYVAAQAEVILHHQNGSKKDLQIFSSTLRLFQELIQKYIPCRVALLDTHYFAVLFYLSEKECKHWRKQLTDSLRQVDNMIFNYYNVHLFFCVGRMVSKIEDVHLSYDDAKQLLSCEIKENGTLFYDEQTAGSVSSSYLISQVKKYIHDNREKKLSLQEISSHFEVSANYLSQLFKKATGTGITDYITKLKIEAAMDLLLTGNQKIYEISDEVGYDSAFYFSKVFKKYTGMSPKEFRNRQ
jgi:two-component system response regulator YesN